MVVLGTIFALKKYHFQVSNRRATKIYQSIEKLQATIASKLKEVPAKLAASFIGLIWSIATTKHHSTVA